MGTINKDTILIVKGIRHTMEQFRERFALNTLEQSVSVANILVDQGKIQIAGKDNVDNNDKGNTNATRFQRYLDDNGSKGGYYEAVEDNKTIFALKIYIGGKYLGESHAASMVIEFLGDVYFDIYIRNYISIEKLNDMQKSRVNNYLMKINKTLENQLLENSIEFVIYDNFIRPCYSKRYDSFTLFYGGKYGNSEVIYDISREVYDISCNYYELINNYLREVKKIDIW